MRGIFSLYLCKSATSVFVAEPVEVSVFYNGKSDFPFFILMKQNPGRMK